MPYDLGVDLGTTYTAAAVSIDGRLEMLSLGNRALQVPSVLFVTSEGDLAVGETAERRGATEPDRLVREFKRRIGDTVPILVGGMPFSPQALASRMVGWVVDAATERQGEPPLTVTLTHPANWGPFKIDLFEQAIHLADLQNAQIITEPEAAAVTYASRSRLDDGDRIAVYDLGGGTFDAAVLQREGDGFRILGSPEGIEHLGGVDFDEAIFRNVTATFREELDSADRDDPGAAMALTRLRRDCVDAKEALSSDTEAVVPVVFPGVNTSVRITRGQFEDLIRLPLVETVAAMGRALRSAETTPEELRSIVLMGGSSRIPLVSEMLVDEFGRPLSLDAHPKHDVALGAAFVGAAAALEARSTHAPATVLEGSTTDSDSGRSSEPPSATPPLTASPVPAPATRHAPAPQLSRRAIAVVGGSVLGLLLAIGGALLAFRGDGDTTKTATTPATSPSASSSATASSPASVALPASAPLTKSQLATSRTVDGKQNIYLIDVNDESALRRLTSDGNAAGSVTLAPDRQTITFLRFINSRGVVWTMAADGSGQRPLFDRPIDGCGDVDHVSWNPADVAQLVVTCKDASRHPNKLLVIGVDGNVIRPLDTGSMFVSDPTISSDGTQVAYWADKRPVSGGSVFTIALDGQKPPQRLTQGGASSDLDPAWAPDGETIAFCRGVVEGTTINFDIYSVDVDSKEITPLVQSPAVDQKPGWSVDGEQLVFVSDRRVRDGAPRGTRDLWVMTVADSGSARPLGVRATVISAPAWGHR